MAFDELFQTLLACGALERKTAKKQPKTIEYLNAEELKSIDLLKDALIPPHVLELPKSTGHSSLEKAACVVQIGCVLLQTQHDNTMRPIWYWSRSLADAELEINYYASQMPRHRLGPLTLSAIPKWNTVHNQYRSRLFEMDFRPHV